MAFGDWQPDYMIHTGGFGYEISRSYAFGNHLVSYRGT